MTDISGTRSSCSSCTAATTIATIDATASSSRPFTGSTVAPVASTYVSASTSAAAASTVTSDVVDEEEAADDDQELGMMYLLAAHSCRIYIYKWVLSNPSPNNAHLRGLWRVGQVAVHQGQTRPFTSYFPGGMQAAPEWSSASGLAALALLERGLAALALLERELAARFVGGAFTTATGRTMMASAADMLAALALIHQLLGVCSPFGGAAPGGLDAALAEGLDVVHRRQRAAPAGRRGRLGDLDVEVGRAATLLPPVLLAEGSALPLLAPTRCVSLGPRTK